MHLQFLTEAKCVCEGYIHTYIYLYLYLYPYIYETHEKNHEFLGERLLYTCQNQTNNLLMFIFQ